MPSTYRLDDISRDYGRVTALDRLTVDINDGPVALIGYSGAGKTTLLRILAGLEAPCAGKIIFNDVEITEKNAQSLRRDVTMLFQEPVLFSRSVLENVMYGLTLRGTSKEEARNRSLEALANLGLETFENRRATKLSGGEQQRVSLARALVLEPKVLLLDEPTSNLDPANATLMISEIREFAKRGLVLISTHNFLDVRRLAKWAIYLEKGKIIDKGSIEDLLDNPKDERVRKFVNGEF